MCCSSYVQQYAEDGQKPDPKFECLYPYFDMRDVLIIQNELVFKGQLLVVPAALRKELMAVVHSSHIGIEGCIRRACDTLYWAQMAIELREYIAKCDVCLAHHTGQATETPPTA